MQKIKVKTAHVRTPEAKARLEYYFLMKGGMCGIEIRETCGGVSTTRFVPDDPEKVYELLRKLARNTLFPVHLGDVVEDYIYEHWLRQGRFELLRTDADTRLDCGERKRELLGDLRARITTNEG